MAELLPCPFCGGEARIIVVEKGVHSIIQCTTSYCGFMRHSFNNGDTDEHAALRLTTAWNTRTLKERDVQEVRHAKFELVNNGKGVCSNCHRLDSIDKLAKYCRYCGAKIDKESEAK